MQDRTTCERCDGACTGACEKGAIWWPDDAMPPGPLAAALSAEASGRDDRDASLMRQAAAFIERRIAEDTERMRAVLGDAHDGR